MMACSGRLLVAVLVLEVAGPDTEHAAQRDGDELGRDHHVRGQLVRRPGQRQDRLELGPASPVGQPRPVDHRHDRDHAEVVLVAVDQRPLVGQVVVAGPVRLVHRGVPLELAGSGWTLAWPSPSFSRSTWLP
jgi:hypothetical protein